MNLERALERIAVLETLLSRACTFDWADEGPEHDLTSDWRTSLIYSGYVPGCPEGVDGWFIGKTTQDGIHLYLDPKSGEWEIGHGFDFLFKTIEQAFAAWDDWRERAEKDGTHTEAGWNREMRKGLTVRVVTEQEARQIAGEPMGGLPS